MRLEHETETQYQRSLSSERRLYVHFGLHHFQSENIKLTVFASVFVIEYLVNHNQLHYRFVP